MFKRFLIALASVSVLFCGLIEAKSEKIVLVTSNWRPYIQADAASPGFAHELVTNAFAQAGLDIEVRFMSWTEALLAAESGKVDGIFPIYQTKLRKDQFAFSKPFLGGPLGLYQRRGQNISLKDPEKQSAADLLKSLSSYRFGVVKHYAYFPAFDDSQILKKVTVLSEEENLQQLVDGKVDFIIMEKLVASYWLAHGKLKAKINEVECVVPEIATQKLYVAIPKRNRNHKKWLKAFNHGLKEITTNGTLSHLLDQDARRLHLRAIA